MARQTAIEAFAEENTADTDTDTVESDLMQPAQDVIDLVDIDHLKDRLEGRDGGLRTSKPQAANDSGLEQYTWRMARFHAGADPSMPITASWWLQEWLDENNIDASVAGLKDDAGDEITDVLDVVAKCIIAEWGYDPERGIGRWQRAFGL